MAEITDRDEFDEFMARTIGRTDLVLETKDDKWRIMPTPRI